MTKFDYEIDDFRTFCSSKDLSDKTKISYEQTLRLYLDNDIVISIID